MLSFVGIADKFFLKQLKQRPLSAQGK